MSKGPWKRLHGLPRLRWRETDDGLDSDGRPKLTDCTIFGTRAVVMAAGFTNVTRGRRALEEDPRFHHYVMRLDCGRGEWATHQSSAQRIGQIMREEGRDRSLANLGRPRAERQESGEIQVWRLSGGCR